jgi:hypothetical protein
MMHGAALAKLLRRWRRLRQRYGRRRSIAPRGALDGRALVAARGAARAQRRDALAGMGIEATIVPQSNVLDGITVVRWMLGRTWINSNRCERGIEALRQYRREWNET